MFILDENELSFWQFDTSAALSSYTAMTHDILAKKMEKEGKKNLTIQGIVT